MTMQDIMFDCVNDYAFANANTILYTNYDCGEIAEDLQKHLKECNIPAKILHIEAEDKFNNIRVREYHGIQTYVYHDVVLVGNTVIDLRAVDISELDESIFKQKAAYLEDIEKLSECKIKYTEI